MRRPLVDWSLQPVSVAIAMAAILACTVTAAAGPVTHYEGAAYAAADGRLLYRESHWIYEENGGSARVVLYRCPDGSPFARKRVQASPDPQAPDFEMRDARSGYVEGVRGGPGGRVVYARAGIAAGERSALLKTSADTVIDAGFDAFVQAHWSELSSGATVPLSFVVPSRLAAMHFKVSRVDDARTPAPALLHVRLQLASWYGALLPHIDVYYTEATRALRRYAGMSNVRDAASNNVEVRIEFPGDERDAADPRDVVDALAEALTGTCRLS